MKALFTKILQFFKLQMPNLNKAFLQNNNTYDFSRNNLMLAQLHKWNKKVENNFLNKIKNKERFKIIENQ